MISCSKKYNKQFNKSIIIIALSLVLSFLIEGYIIIIENQKLFFKFSFYKFFNLFSFKEFIILLIIFLIAFHIFFDNDKRNKLLNFIYKYRLPLSIIVIFVAVIFQIHGSSINQLNYFNVNHHPLIGISRAVRTDEYAVNTPFAFSQYFNNFTYFSDIVGGSLMDMFIIYGQPVWDIGMIFRPFLIGYLFLNQGQGLSFFWVGRLVFLFLVSFEFGMLLTNKNKTLSLAYTFLITFSPLIQWWFAINGLVEQLIFGQLGILLIYWYMVIDNYKKRLVIGFGLMVSWGTYLLVFYPAWQISFMYVFIVLSVYVFFKNKSTFKFNKNDLFIAIFYLSIFMIIIFHILSNSFDTIVLSMNTIYPGSEIFNGGGFLNGFTYYISQIFTPIEQENLILNVCEYGVFIDLFPLPIILANIVLFYQRTKDKLLYVLLVLYVILVVFYLFTLPDFITVITLRNHIRTHRILSAITFVGVIILIRCLSNLKCLKNKKLFMLLSLILSVTMVYLSIFEFNSYYLSWMPIFAVVFYFILFSVTFFASSKRNQKIFLICVIALSFLSGGLVNPVDYGTDVIFESDFTQHVEQIVENNPNGLWITQNIFINYLIPLGAKTINSDQTYPDFEKWQKIDTKNQYKDVYNRYAHVNVEIQDSNDTYFELQNVNAFLIHLNVNDLEKLNVSYITTTNNLNILSNDHIDFEECYHQGKYKIYCVKYN